MSSFKSLDFLGSRRATVLIFTIGIVLRIGLLAALADNPLFGDAGAYHSWALKILHEDSFDPFLPPGLPYYLAVCYWIFGESELVGKASMLVLWLVFSLVLFFYLRRLSSRKAANLALGFFTFYPTFVIQSVWPLTQLPVAVLLLCVIYSLDVIADKRRLVSAVIGLLLGFVALVRPSSILLAFLIPLWILYRYRAGGIKMVSVLIVAAFIPIACWLAKVHDMTGRWVFISYNNSMNLYLGNNEYTPLYKTWWFGSHGAGDVDVPEDFTRKLDSLRTQPRHLRDKLYYSLALNHICSRPDLFALRTLNRIRCFFAFDSATATNALKRFKVEKILGLGILGLDAFSYCMIMLPGLLFLFLFRDSYISSERLTILVGIIFVYSAPYWIAFSHPTYHFPVVPLFAVAAAVFWVSVLEKPGAYEKVIRSLKSSLAFWLLILAFIYIQVEWIFVMYSRYSALP